MLRVVGYLFMLAGLALGLEMVMGRLPAIPFFMVVVPVFVVLGIALVKETDGHF